MSDGAAAVLLGSASAEDNYKIIPKAKILAHASFAFEPLYFTKSPIFAIEKVLKMTGMDINEIDLFEIK